MEITIKDLGKIVELPAKKEWGSGIITKTDMRFAHIVFQGEEGPAKKFFLEDNSLILATNQDVPALVKRGRIKNKKIKPKVVIHLAN
jgi:hypothetical protein